MTTSHDIPHLEFRGSIKESGLMTCPAKNKLTLYKQENAMNDKIVDSIHWSFWLIVVVSLLWNVMGLISFLIQMSPDMLTTYRESERTIIENRPIWTTSAFAIAVFGGALGCLLLFFRKSLATIF